MGQPVSHGSGFQSSISLQIQSYIEIDCHFIKEKVVAKQIDLRYVPTADQIVDVFIKPLTTSRFHYLKDKLLRGNDEITNQDSEKQPSQLQMQALVQQSKSTSAALPQDISAASVLVCDTMCITGLYSQEVKWS